MVFYRGYIGIVENEMETTTQGLGLRVLEGILIPKPEACSGLWDPLLPLLLTSWEPDGPLPATCP